MASPDPKDLLDSLDILEVLVAPVPKEIEDSQEHLVLVVLLVPLVLKVLLDSLGRRETQVMPSRLVV